MCSIIRLFLSRHLYNLLTKTCLSLCAFTPLIITSRLVLSDGDAEVVEDLIVAAFSDAKVKVEAHVAEEMSKITGGLNLPPGMTLPF